MLVVENFEYANFLNIARGSAAEAAYLVLLACELEYFSASTGASLQRESAFDPTTRSAGSDDAFSRQDIEGQNERLPKD
jgi:23S rRNA-intervening sequence protein